MNPSSMPKKIVVETRIVAVDYDAQSFVGEFVEETMRVVGTPRPSETEKAQERRYQKWMAELDRKDGVLKGITDDRSYTAARRKVGLR